MAICQYGNASTVINYMLTNVYNLDLYTNDMVDCLVSCAPTPGWCTFNGQDARVKSANGYGTTVPLYVGFWTHNKHNSVMVYNRSRDINLHTMDTLQMRRMVMEIEQCS